MGLQVPMVFEVQSIPALRDIALRGLAACIMPYGTAINEIKRGALAGRRIVDPAITRTLYIFRPPGQAALVQRSSPLPSDPGHDRAAQGGHRPPRPRPPRLSRAGRAFDGDMMITRRGDPDGCSPTTRGHLGGSRRAKARPTYCAMPSNFRLSRLAGWNNSSGWTRRTDSPWAWWCWRRCPGHACWRPCHRTRSLAPSDRARLSVVPRRRARPPWSPRYRQGGHSSTALACSNALSMVAGSHG